jgi:hypothetical protein
MRKLALLALIIAFIVLATFVRAYADTASAAASGIVDGIVTAIVGTLATAVVALALAGWAALKAYAAHSAAKWDDEAVALVEKIAQGVVDKKTQPVAGTDH